MKKRTISCTAGISITAAILFCSLTQLAGCSEKEQKYKPVADLPGKYVLVFQDEFDGETLDTTVWGFHAPGKRRSAVNVREACLLNGKGELEIRNWTEISENDTVHHAGMIETRKDFAFGYYEARIKFNIREGSWGAFWIMYRNTGKTYGEKDNPRKDGTEIDIMEFVPLNGRYGCHNLHWNGYGEFIKSRGSGELMNGLLDDYHIYSLLWTRKGYIFYIDGQETWRSGEGVSHVPEYVILSTEIQDGGWAGDIPESGYGSFGETENIMYVDYIRVFRVSSGYRAI
ncbi:MAG TPA: glycoside hydrolase family 16 protein [Bacteroidales bacterium]|nr:glycoside hydrolase family 16 protein [Bacteroidales bacterium]HQH23697.1 glycoside hydrolase family 16 protein [Bacteroidales bacterium]HQJ82298.1 glycoside hydrolase family 16 protein [Bacteroidales bacterium]